METTLDLSPFNKVADVYTLGHADRPLLMLAWQLATGPACINCLVVDRDRDYSDLVERLFAFCRELKPMLGYNETALTAAHHYWIRRRRPRADKDTQTQLLVCNLDTPVINGQILDGMVLLWHLRDEMIDGPHLPNALLTRFIPVMTEETTIYRVR